MGKKLIIGTYAERGSVGIYETTLNNGVLEAPKAFAAVKDAKYIAVEGNRIASICKLENGCGVSLISETGEVLDSVAYERKSSCYVTWHEGKIYTANYHEGSFSVITAADDRLHFEKTVHIQEGAGCHEVLFYKDEILVPCLFLDRIMIFDSDLNYKGSIRFEMGTGPRHGVFTKDQKTLYLVSELSNEIFAIDMETKKVTMRNSVLPAGKKHVRGTAAIRMSEDEKTLYVSTRGEDLISVISASTLNLRQSVYCGGRHPRDFIVYDGYVLVANRYSDSLVALRLDEEGLIHEETCLIGIPSAVSIDVL